MNRRFKNIKFIFTVMLTTITVWFMADYVVYELKKMGVNVGREARAQCVDGVDGCLFGWNADGDEGQNWTEWTWTDDAAYGNLGWLKDDGREISGQWVPRMHRKHGYVEGTYGRSLAEIVTNDRAPSTSTGGALRIYELDEIYRAQWYMWLGNEPLSSTEYGNSGVTNNDTDRFEFYIKIHNTTPIDYGLSGDSVIHVGTYLCGGGRCPDEGFPSSYNQHYYHYVRFSPDTWVHVVLNRHPHHRRGESFPDEPVDDPAYSAGVTPNHYFYDFHEMYIDVGADYANPTSYIIDEMKFYSTGDTHEPNQNDISVGSANVAYWQDDDHWELGFADLSLNTIGCGDGYHTTFQIRYSTEPITNANFDSAATIEPQYYANERCEGCISRMSTWRRFAWAKFTLPDEIEANYNRIYFAIKDVSEIAEGDIRDASSPYIHTIDYYLRPDSGSDTTSPTRSNGVPTGELTAGTTQTTISLSTNESATCKYGTVASIPYNDLPNTFSTTDSMSHSTIVSGLSDGNSYTYYVRCQDESGNLNPDDYLITFYVAQQQACDYCSEQNCADYLICEDWETGTPPDPWPIEGGKTWHGWTPANYGNCPNDICLGDISNEYAHSGNRSLLQWKQAGGKSAVDLEYTFPDTGVIYVRFYLLIPNQMELNSTVTNHFMFVNTATIAACGMEFKHCGELNIAYGYNPYIDCSSVLGSGNYVIDVSTTESHASGEEFIANNQDIPVQDGGNRNYFILQEHIGEWILVEWKVDFINDITSLWINEEAHVTNYSYSTRVYPYDSAHSIIFSGYAQNLETEMHYYIDDIVVSTSYIGPKNRGPDTTPPIRSNPQPTGPLTSGTTQTNISLTTNETATCKYSTTPNTAYSSMTNTFSRTNSTTHSQAITNLSDGTSYTYYVRCQDTATPPNQNTADFAISFSIANAASDTTAPVRSNTFPQGELDAGTTSIDISLGTDENATCKYSAITGRSYAEMTQFTNTTGTNHLTEVTGLENGFTYNYYVKCKDESDNINTDDFAITFSVADTQGTNNSTSSSGGRSCFIATAAYGTPLAEEVKVLSRFRDKHLLTNYCGKIFVNMYYKYSPKMAEYLRDSGWARNVVRLMLRPLVKVTK